MLKVKMMICLLSFIFLFNTYNISIITPFNPLAITDLEDKNEDKNIEIIHKDKMNLIKKPIEIQYETLKQKELEKEKKQNEPQWREFILTFYTSLESENSSAGPVTCQNKPLSRGGVANNVIPQNTKIYLEGYGQVVVNDRGSDKYFGVDNRLDVFIERESGESDRQYSKRVKSYGIQKVKGYMIK